MWRSLGYPVVMIDGPTSIAQAEKDIRIIAAAVGETERGEKVVAEMERQLKKWTVHLQQGIFRPRQDFLSPK